MRNKPNAFIIETVDGETVRAENVDEVLTMPEHEVLHITPQYHEEGERMTFEQIHQLKDSETKQKIESLKAEILSLEASLL